MPSLASLRRLTAPLLTAAALLAVTGLTPARAAANTHPTTSGRVAAGWSSPGLKDT